MSKSSVVVTGIARHSLGEAITRALIAESVIGIDKQSNAELRNCPNLHQITLDLNPLYRRGGISGLSAQLLTKLAESLRLLHADRIAVLIQCAAAYEFGSLLDHTVDGRNEVVGLNILGAIEVLHAVMSLNQKYGGENNERLTHVLVGSYQGLNVKDRRPLYASSKAFAIDLCTSMVRGKELAKCLYLAPGPIDTPMLHRNHWVTRASGSEGFFSKLLAGPREEYQSIFVRCNHAELNRIAQAKFRSEAGQLRSAMSRYQKIRRRVRNQKLGILSVQSCAEIVAKMVRERTLNSGVYVIRENKKTSEPRVEFATFAKLDRRGLFASICSNVEIKKIINK